MPTMNLTYTLILVLLSIGSVTSKTQGEYLADLVNDYRQTKGLPRVPYSKTLMKVAKLHCEVSCKVPSLSNRKCWNPHSWDYVPNMSQDYKTCCYSPFDGSSYKCIWDKPKEIGGFDVDGFEITAGGSSSLKAFLQGWKDSSSHNDVILEQNSWRYYDWEAIGCGAVVGSVAHCWFAKKKDSSYYRSPGDPSSYYCSGRGYEEGWVGPAIGNEAINKEKRKIGWIVGGLLLGIMVCVIMIVFCLVMRRKRRAKGVKVGNEEEEEEDGVEIKFEDEAEMDGVATKTVE